MTVLSVLSAGAARGVFTTLGDALRAAAGDPDGFTARFAPVGVLSELVRAGTSCDLLVTSRPQFALLAKAGFVAPGTERTLGGVDTGMAVRSGTDGPDIGTVAAIATVAGAAPTIHLGDRDRSTAGVHVADVLARCGVLPGHESHVVEYSSGAVAMRGLAGDTGRGAVGFAQATEVAETVGVRWCGPLPGEFGLRTDYVVCAPGADARATAMAEILAGDASSGIRRAAGFIV